MCLKQNTEFENVLFPTESIFAVKTQCRTEKKQGLEIWILKDELLDLLDFLECTMHKTLQMAQDAITTIKHDYLVYVYVTQYS